MKLGCVPQAVGFYLSFTVLWAAQMLLASVNMLQCGHPVSTQDSRCAPQKDDLKNPEEADFQIKGYTFSEPFHLIVSYDWLILQAPSRPIFEGDPLVLHCRAWQDWPLAQVTFFRNGQALGPPGTSREFSRAVAREGDSGHYHCRGVFRNLGPGSPETASPVAITVQELFAAPVLRATPSAQPQEGDLVTLSCLAKLALQRSTTRLLFSFHRNGVTLLGPGPSAQFQIPSVTRLHAGAYWCEVATEDSHVQKQSPRLELRLQDPSSTIAPLSMNPTPQKMAAPETAHTDSQDPPPSATSSEDSGSSSSQFRSDPFLHHQMGVLLKQVQDVKTLLGYLVMELRDLSSHQKPRTTKDPSKKK
ncbi:Fc receptor-like A isoform X2 [Erinaceus europaeus]|uniref:Fc receptor-like A isoform X2 n=1 Tax=Erinaceus europaeus TaxID=9365 RepID=A0ABM3XZ37_ERIEU|nr:Fc receptor-like A isoform X2 [Erinaceus europaeus]